MQEAEIGRITVPLQPWQQRPSQQRKAGCGGAHIPVVVGSITGRLWFKWPGQKTTRAKPAGGVAQ
jgi:hypothetical protein